MRNVILKLAVVMGIVVSVLVLPVYAADVVAGVEVNSAYVTRGVAFNDGLVIQPSIIVEKSGLELFVWGNIDVGDYDGRLKSGECSEINVDISHGVTLLGMDVRLGLIQYLYPGDGRGDETGEIYGSLSRSIIGPVSLTLDAYYDYNEIKDGYGRLSISYEDTLGDGWIVTTGAAIGVAGRAHSAMRNDGWHDYEFFAGAAYAFNSGIGVSFKIAYADTLDKEVLAEQDTNLYGGIGLKYIF